MNATEMTLKQMAETIKNRWREKSPGGCRMLSRGDDCNCTLCLVDNLLAAALSKVPKGPWRSENICDENRNWGPCVWDSRVDANGYGIAGTSLFYFPNLMQAEAVRDTLNCFWINDQT
jgi:hypothetical protein